LPPSSSPVLEPSSPSYSSVELLAASSVELRYSLLSSPSSVHILEDDSNVGSTHITSDDEGRARDASIFSSRVPPQTGSEVEELITPDALNMVSTPCPISG
jgi:hypothetical protein